MDRRCQWDMEPSHTSQQQLVPDTAVGEEAALHNHWKKSLADAEIDLEQSFRGYRNRSRAPEERGVLTPCMVAEAEVGRHIVASGIGREAVLAVAAVVVRCRATLSNRWLELRA